MRSPPAERRDGFLDLLRGAALLRVVAWHATGAAALTYVFAAIPVMFFVSGSLFGRSLARRPARAVVADRLRRLAPSVWVFTAVAWTIMAVGAARSSTELEWRRVVFWIIPVVNPQGSAWENGWLSSPLWYVRVLLWVTLLAPLLARGVRRWGWRLPVVLACSVLALDVLQRHLATPSQADALWQLGDLPLYGAFFAVGCGHGTGRLAEPTSRRALGFIALAVAGASVWSITQPVPLGVVNNSHPLHLLVGAAWLLAVLTGRRALERLAELGRLDGLVRFLGRRSLSIYLWHTAAIATALHVLQSLPPLPPVANWALLAGLVVAGTALAVAVFGVVEDWGARRPADWRLVVLASSRTNGTLVAASMAALALAIAAGSLPGTEGGARAWPPTPSQAPPRPEPTIDGPVLVAPFDPDRFTERIDSWMASSGAADVLVAVDDGQRMWTYARSLDDQHARSAEEELTLYSITKLFTASLVYRAVDQGLIDLDEPFPQLEAVPDFPFAGQFSVRDALGHRTGMTNYWDVPTFWDEPEAVQSPADAIRLTASTGLLLEPGSGAHYSSTNYLLLGYLLEQRTGRSFDDLLRSELLDPLGLLSVAHDPPGPGAPNFATGGLRAGVLDLLRAGRAIIAESFGLRSDIIERARIDPESGIGGGIFGFCPCAASETGPRYSGFGHNSGRAILVYVPDDDVVVFLDSSGPLEGLFALFGDLFAPLDPAPDGDAALDRSSATPTGGPELFQ